MLPVPAGGAFTYAVKDGMKVDKGDLVTVPFGKRRMTGVVWEGDPPEKEMNIKEIAAVLPLPPLTENNRRFIDWVSGYTLFDKGAILKMTLCVDGIEDEKIPEGVVRAENVPDMRLTAERERALAVLSATPQTVADIVRAANVSTAVVTGLVKAGAAEKRPMPRMTFQNPSGYDGAVLSEKQRAVADRLKNAVGNGFSPFVLEGVTGSGKTEVYFDAVAEALKQNRQVLVLLPEIGLTTQWTDRFEKRFGVAPALWHSDLTPAVRRATWRAVLKGDIRVLAGARSALFLPFPELGLIIVDEEHDSSYKQEDGVTYQARNMAVVRAKTEKIPVVLSSATPSLETVVNAQTGRYIPLKLTERFGNAVLPRISLIDMRHYPPEKDAEHKNFLSPVLTEAIAEKLNEKEQILLFLNRRGYAPLVLCPDCGHRFCCPHCDAWLVEHKRAFLQCHHCGHTVKKPDVCPVCGGNSPLASCGPGVERIFEEISRRFPQAHTVLASADTVDSPARFSQIVRDIENGDTDIIIGTQILAKGHHFPRLTLVGVVDADLGLSGGDLRAGEKTFQLLQQVAGRAGRADKKGDVFLQTFDPENAVMQALAANDKDAFIETEINARRALGMPPFGQTAAIIVSGNDPVKTENTAALFGKNAPRGDGIRVLGPAPAPMAFLRGRHRHRLLLQTAKNVNIQHIVAQWTARVPVPSSVRVKIDIDPYSFY